MIKKLESLLAEANAAKEAAGRSEEGRCLAILATQIEVAFVWASHHNLGS